MSNIKTVKISIKTDEHGLVGRQCPECERDFKVKFGTGLSVTTQICPYCGHKGEGNEFFTTDQNDYIRSYLTKEFLEPGIRDLQSSFKKLENSSSKYFKIKVQSNNVSFSLKDYEEKKLETEVECNNCGLIFSIYGVFSNCPDCGKLNSLIILKRSLETCRKKIDLSKNPDVPLDIAEALVSDSLGGTVSSFDSFGKSIRKKYPLIFPSTPKNLFQNISLLDEILLKEFTEGIEKYVGKDEKELLLLMFQVRHIQIHNTGVVDEDFIRKLPNLWNLIGRKYNLVTDDVLKFIDSLEVLSEKIMRNLE